MRNIEFDELCKDHLFDYKDGDLLVIDDISRLELSDYENTALSFVLAVFCEEGRLQAVVDGREYRLSDGDLFVYMPGQVFGEILLSQHARVKVLAFAQRAVDRSIYLNKYVWDCISSVRRQPLFSLSGTERQLVGHYYNLVLLKMADDNGIFHRDIIRLLFQSMMLEFLMFVERKGMAMPDADGSEEQDAKVRQPALLYRRFMRLLAEQNGRECSVGALAEQLNVTPKYLSQCVKAESGRSPRDLITESTVVAIRQRLRYSEQTVKEICTELGFPNLSFFGKFVKKHLGLSPTAFRKQSLKDG